MLLDHRRHRRPVLVSGGPGVAVHEELAQVRCRLGHLGRLIPVRGFRADVRLPGHLTEGLVHRGDLPPHPGMPVAARPRHRLQVQRRPARGHRAHDRSDGTGGVLNLNVLGHNIPFGVVSGNRAGRTTTCVISCVESERPAGHPSGGRGTLMAIGTAPDGLGAIWPGAAIHPCETSAGGSAHVRDRFRRGVVPGLNPQDVQRGLWAVNREQVQHLLGHQRGHQVPGLEAGEPALPGNLVHGAATVDRPKDSGLVGGFRPVVDRTGSDRHPIGDRHR